MAGVDNPLDGPLFLLGLAHQGLDVDDALALLAGDLGPVVRIGRVGQILVLLELLAHRAHHVVEVDALLARLDVALERQLLGPPHHRLDHGPRGEVLEVQDLLVTVGVGYFEEPVLLAEVVHLLHRRCDHAVDGRLDVAGVLAQLGVVDGQLRRQVLLEDVYGSGGVWTLDLDLHVEAATTITLRRCSTPSISARSCGTMVVSTSEEMPEPRVRNSASISSKNTMTGTSSAAFSRALTKISRIFRSVSPTYLFKSSGPLMLRK